MERETDPDVAWVEALAGATRPAAQRAIDEAAGENRLFRSIAAEHAKEGRASYIEIDAPLELHALVRLRKPRHVVEVGVSSGVSSAYLLHALERNGLGTLHSVDLPQLDRTTGSTRPRHSWSLPNGRSTGWAVPFPLRKRWDLRLGDKRVVLPMLAQELPRIDLLVYDVPHEDSATFREFLSLDPRFPAHGIAIADHGPTGGLCGGLRRWAIRRGATPVRRAGLGLFGFRAGPRAR
ncbi:MAG: class I SAM-dependent methyltransferase [Thermoplasmata archaeon]|nr:class I SAM-dependent methyltransferase [Thermoplasmata archaeon]